MYSPYDTVAAQEDAFTDEVRRFYESVEWEYRDGEVELDRKKERERLYVILLLFLVRMHEDGYADGAERLRRVVPAIPPVNFPVPAEAPAFIFAKEEAARASRSIVDTIHDEMKAAAARAKDEGLPPDEVKAAAGAKLGELTKIGPERVSSTETVNAFSKGTIEAWKDSGVVEYKTWHTQEDGRVCEFCIQMNGISAKLDEPWFLKGETLEFGDLKLVLDYDNIDGPPIHPSCRCFIDFVLESDNES